MANTELTLTGMTCGGCARSIQRKLSGLPGVESAQVSLDDAKAAVSFDPALTSPGAMVAAVVSIGFQAGVQDTPVA